MGWGEILGFLPFGFAQGRNDSFEVECSERGVRYSLPIGPKPGNSWS